jgi:hypothetical protein
MNKVTLTSRLAYRNLKNKGTQSARILDYIDEQGTATRGMIAKALNMEKSTVSARVNVLLNGIYTSGGICLQKQMIEVSHVGKCPVSKVLVQFLQRKSEYLDQPSLFGSSHERTNTN